MVADNARKILSCWRRENGGNLLDLEETELPALRADFSHVERLSLRKISWSDSANTFLQSFTRLQRLDIRYSPGLTAWPDEIGGMDRLTVLNLTSNGLRLTPQSAAKLSAMSNLEHVSLNRNPLGAVPDFSAMPRLKHVGLGGTELDRWPTGLRAETGLQQVDLSNNRLSEVPEVNLNPPADQLESIARFNRITWIKGNRFPVDYWRKIDSFWLRLGRERPDLLDGALPDAFEVGGPRSDRYLGIYPGRSFQQAREFLRNQGEGADAELLRLEGEHSRLIRSTDIWRDELIEVLWRADGEVRREHVQAPNTARDRIVECWRRETDQVLASDGTSLGYTLNLSNLNLPSLPVLGVDFSHVASLKLNVMQLRTLTQGFISCFPNLRMLQAIFNELEEVPLALGDMHALTELDLGDNRIRLTEQTSTMLSGLTSLQKLTLGNNTLNITPDVSQMTDLRHLDLRNAGISTWPRGLHELQALEQVHLENNEIETIPDAVIAPTDVLMARTKRVNDVTTVHNNPLLEPTLQKVREYGERLRREGLELTDTSNGFVNEALRLRPDNALQSLESYTRMSYWTRDLSYDESVSKQRQWRALDAQQRSDGLFNQINKLEPTEADFADLQRRVWEVIDAISLNTAESERLRAQVFELGALAKDGEPAAFFFNTMELVVRVSKARATAGDQTQRPQLQALARGLFRLDELDRIAMADIARSQAIARDSAAIPAHQLLHAMRRTKVVEIRQAYRIGLSERLQLPVKPQQMKFPDLIGVSQRMLDAAYEEIVSLDNSPKEFQALLSRGFWQDYLTSKYREQFVAQNKPFQEQLADLTRRFNNQALAEALYLQQTDDVGAQWAIKDTVLFDTLTRQEIAEALLPREKFEVLENTASGLQLAQAQAIEFGGKPYFIASMPDAGDGEHYVLWVQAPDNPFVLISSAIIAKPDVAGVWKRRGLAGGMRPGVSQQVFEDASESMPMVPYTPQELDFMRRDVHYTTQKNQLGTYNRANNGKYPLRDLQGRPVRIRSLERQAALDSGTVYTSAQIKPYIQFEGYERVGALYEEKLQWRRFTADDVKVPGEKALIGQSMVVANRRIAKGEIVGLYGGVIIPHSLPVTTQSTFGMVVGYELLPDAGSIRPDPIFIMGDTIISRINTHFDYDPNGKPIRQAAGGYNVECVPFEVEAVHASSAAGKRTSYRLNTVFATEDIPAGVELRMDYGYTEGMIKTKFS